MNKIRPQEAKDMMARHKIMTDSVIKMGMLKDGMRIR
jgi:hypothetical protein